MIPPFQKEDTVLVCSSITARGFSSLCLLPWDPCLFTLSRMLSRLGLDVIAFLSMLDSGDDLHFPVASSPPSFPLFLNDELHDALMEEYSAKDIDPPHMMRELRRSYSSRISTIASLASSAGMSLRELLIRARERRISSGYADHLPDSSSPSGYPLPLSILHCLHLLLRLAGHMDIPDAFFTARRKDGWNPLLPSLPPVLFPLSMDIADFISCVDGSDDIVLSPSSLFRGRMHGGIMDTVWMMHREEGNTKGSISRDTGNGKPNVIRMMGRMDGEIALATVMRYIRPMDIPVSEVFRRHGRRMEALEAAISEDPSDDEDNEEDEE